LKHFNDPDENKKKPIKIVTKIYKAFMSTQNYKKKRKINLKFWKRDPSTHFTEKKISFLLNFPYLVYCPIPSVLFSSGVANFKKNIFI